MKILRKEYKDFLKKKSPGDYARALTGISFIDCPVNKFIIIDF